MTSPPPWNTLPPEQQQARYESVAMTQIPVQRQGPRDLRDTLTTRARWRVWAASAVGVALVGTAVAFVAVGPAAVTGTPTASAAGLAVTKQLKAAEAARVADREVCVEFDARGGVLYNVFVVPMMTGPSGQKSINVDIARMTRATAQLIRVGSTSNLADASSEIRDQTQRMVTSAGALGIYDHTEGTALLTSFVSLAVACTSAGQKPTWFDPSALTTA